MEALAKLRERVNGAAPGAATNTNATRELAIDWFWALASFGLALAMFARADSGPRSPTNAGSTPWASCSPRECRCRCWRAAEPRSRSSWW